MLDSIFTTFYVSENSGNSAPVIGKNPAIIGESNNAIFHPDEALEVQILNISFSDVKKEIENEISKLIGKIELNKTINNGQVASKKAKKKRKKTLNLRNKIMSLENLLNYECIEDIDISVLGKDEVVNFLENKGISNSKICGLIKKLFLIFKDFESSRKSSLFSKGLILNTKGGCLPFIAIKAPVYPNYPAKGYREMRTHDLKRMVKEVPLLFTLRIWPKGKKQSYEEDWTENPVICAGMCMFCAKSIEVIQTDGSKKFLTSRRPEDKIDGTVSEINISRLPTIYEEIHLQNIFNAIKSVTHNNNKIETVAFDIPSLPYYLYGIDILESGYISVDKINTYFEAVYQKSVYLKTKIIAMMKSYNTARNRSGYNPINITFSTIEGDLKKEIIFMKLLSGLTPTSKIKNSFLEYIKRYSPGYIREGMDSEDWYSLGARSYSWFYEKNKPSIVIEDYTDSVIASKLQLNVRFIGFYLRSLIVNQTQRGYDDVERRMYRLYYTGDMGGGNGEPLQFRREVLRRSRAINNPSPILEV